MASVLPVTVGGKMMVVAMVWCRARGLDAAIQTLRQTGGPHVV
jgi:hypothetical protein